MLMFSDKLPESSYRTIHYTEFENSSGENVYITSEDSDEPLELLAKIIKSDEPSLKEVFAKLANTITDIINYEKSLKGALESSIQEILAKGEIEVNGLYDYSEIKEAKAYRYTYGPKHGIKRIEKEYVDYIDQNVRFFIKNNRIYAGLVFLNNEIQSLKCVMLTGRDSTGIIFKSSQGVWYRPGYYYTDSESIVMSKIIECLLLLTNLTQNSISIVLICKILNDHTEIRLRTDALVTLVEALINHREIELLEPMVARLKKLEPKHPILILAENTARRVKAMNSISKSLNTDISQFQNMNGIEFERFLEDQFKARGFRVERTKASGDFGADLITETKLGTRAAIQAKRFNQKTNLKAVQEVVASLPHYAADFGIVIATSGFFSSAIELAKTNNVELWDEDKLLQFLGGDLSFSLLNNG